MTRDNLLLVAKPISFREDMIRAIEFGKKTVTRRLMKPQPYGFFNFVIDNKVFGTVDFGRKKTCIESPYRPGDIMSVQEDIFLRVLSVRVQRVEDITDDEGIEEGFSSRAEFLGEFFEIYPKADLRSLVWVYEFERLEVDRV